jgi:hypothetical protein
VKPYYQDDLACGCGCGESPAPGRRFVTRHNLRVMRTRSDEHRRNIGASQRVAWATKRDRMPLGSRRLDGHGYWLVKVREHGGRWDKEHVLVVEEAIGRRLVPGEQVHHINGIRTDNRLENLQLCSSSSEHHLIEGTYKRLLAGLLADGVVIYDCEAKEYRRA